MKKQMLITFVNDKNNTILDSNNFPAMLITGEIIYNKFQEKHLVKSASIDLLNNKLFIYLEKVS